VLFYDTNGREVDRPGAGQLNWDFVDIVDNNDVTTYVTHGTFPQYGLRIIFILDEDFGDTDRTSF